MRARAVALIALAIAVIGGASLWMWRGGRPSDVPVSPSVPAPRVPIAARIAAIAPGDGAPIVVTVRIFNHIARQAASTNAALDAAASPGERRPVEPVTVALAPDAWLDAVRFHRPGGPPVPAAAVRLIRRPDASAHVLGPGDVVHALFEIGAEAAQALNGELRADVSVNGWAVQSNVLTLAVPQDARGRLIARARAAEASGDHAALLAAGDALEAAAKDDPMGAWYRGLALEALGRRAEALAAYQKAASTVDPARMPEAPIELYRRIAALR